MKTLLTTAATITLLSVCFCITGRAEAVQLPKTGQNTCYDQSGVTGNAIPCTGTQQDGALQKGATWFTPRFRENMQADGVTPDGTVTDNTTGLIWMKNANCTDTARSISRNTVSNPGTLLWLDAITWSNSLASGICGLTDNSIAGEWRLPNAAELLSLTDIQSSRPTLTPGHPFLNVFDEEYWTSTSVHNNAPSAWFVDMFSGYQAARGKSYNRRVWPVKGNAINVPKTNQATCTLYDNIHNTWSITTDCTGAAGQDGNLLKGVEYTGGIRFTSSNGTVTDNLTGLVWLSQVRCTETSAGIARGPATSALTFDNALTWTSGLGSGMCGLSDGSAAGSWRIPNRTEMMSLMDYFSNANSTSNAGVMTQRGFTSPPTADTYYWTSSTSVKGATLAWYIGMGDTPNLVGIRTKDLAQFFIPVRGGNINNDLQVSVNGAGSVNSTNQGLSPSINCPGNCIGSYPPATAISLSATSSWYAHFTGWNGACSGSGTCAISMNTPVPVTATFVDNQNIALYDASAPSSVYVASKIQDAYDAMAANQVANGVILPQIFNYFENLQFASPVNLLLSGGWNTTYDNNPQGFTTVTGSLSIGRGMVVVQNIILK